VQSAVSSAVNQSTLAFISNVTIGDLLIAMPSNDSGPSGISVTGDSQGNTWTKDVDLTVNTKTVQTWHTVASATGANTVSFSNSTNIGLDIIAEFSGVSATVDAFGSGTTSPSITTTQAYDLLVSAARVTASNPTIVAPTLLLKNSNFTLGYAWSAYQVVPGVGAITAGFSGGGSPAYESVAYKATAVSSPGNNGDWYLNTSTGVLWGPKTGGVWGISTFDLLPTAGESHTNCSSSASPAVCGAASTGSIVVAAAGTSIVVNTTAVTANSQIFLMYDSSLGTKLSVTCNVTEPALYGVTAKVAATSFTLTSTASVTNPACFSYMIIN
jgi:hypothetical protein